MFAWRFGDPGTGGDGDRYTDGRIYFDDFVSSGSTQTRRDGLFALNGDVTGPIVPETTSVLLAALAWLGLVGRCRARCRG
jgi:hypothetical protein